ncbi:C6 finger domain-containing protein [Ceratocystis lukuohia]
MISLKSHPDESTPQAISITSAMTGTSMNTNANAHVIADNHANSAHGNADANAGINPGADASGDAGSVSELPRPGSPPQTKARKACHNGESCRRCSKAGVPCVFVPRANASYLRDLIVSSDSRDSDQVSFNRSVESRLKRIEDYLGLADGLPPPSPPSVQASEVNVSADAPSSPDSDVFSALWPAVLALKKACTVNVSARIWDRGVIKALWRTFHDAMPGLHFLPSKQTFSSPRPLLLAGMLYCSSVRGSEEAAALSADYFEIGTLPPDLREREEWAFQTILGLILAGLLREAINAETGLWISLAYRLLLDHCPSESDITVRGHEWRCLFSGLQIVDLEHASLALACPVVPMTAPFPRLQVPLHDQLYRLSRMMHTGLTHFTGRGLPTVWSVFSQDTVNSMASSTPLPLQLQQMSRPSQNAQVPFTAVDAAVIRDWARQLDDWLVEFSGRAYESEHEKKLVFRQYVLHRLFVLSIYHPARGCNLFANEITPNEQHELLVSARAAVRLHVYDPSIWSNWDLIVITWAALIVLQGVEGGMGEATDIEHVSVHLKNLTNTNELKPSIRELLALNLQQRMRNMHSPVDLISQSGPVEIAEDASNWYIFNEASLQAGYELWQYDQGGEFK